jgi:hypothetical protein
MRVARTIVSSDQCKAAKGTLRTNPGDREAGGPATRPHLCTLRRHRGRELCADLEAHPAAHGLTEPAREFQDRRITESPPALIVFLVAAQRGRKPSGAVPGLAARDDPPPWASVTTIDVDGESFAVRLDARNGVQYEWLSGPNRGYGFGVTGDPDPSIKEHRVRIRSFLNAIDPATGYLHD